MTKNFTDQEDKEFIEQVRKMNGDELMAYIDAVIKREQAKKALKEAEEAERKLEEIRRRKQKK